MQRTDKLGLISKKLQSGVVLVADTQFLCLQLHLPLDAFSPCWSCEITGFTAKIQAMEAQVRMAIWHCDLTLKGGFSQILQGHLRCGLAQVP